MKTYEGSHYPDHEDQDFSESSISSKGRNSGSYQSPAFSDDEMTGRLSPFHLDRYKCVHIDMSRALECFHFDFMQMAAYPCAYPRATTSGNTKLSY